MKIEKIWFDNDYIYIKTDSGHIVGNPLCWFPVLQNATKEQRENYRIGYYGIHWPLLDEDLSTDGFFDYKRKHSSVV